MISSHDQLTTLKLTGPGERVWPTAPVMSHSSERSGKIMGLTRVVANPNCQFIMYDGRGERQTLRLCLAYFS